MGRFLLRRLVQMVPLLVGITFLSFLIVDLAPGGGHGVSGAFNLSTIELFAKAVPR
jgi:ABC-type microcin C transport system permease subunit YejB